MLNDLPNFTELLKGRHGFRPEPIPSETYSFVHSLTHKNASRASSMAGAVPDTRDGSQTYVLPSSGRGQQQQVMNR